MEAWVYLWLSTNVWEVNLNMRRWFDIFQRNLIFFSFWSYFKCRDSRQKRILVSECVLRGYVLSWMMLPYIELQSWWSSKELAVRNYLLFYPFVLCLVDQERFETWCYVILFSFWSLLLIFSYIYVIIPFGILWISHSKVMYDLVMIFGVSISCITLLALMTIIVDLH